MAEITVKGIDGEVHTDPLIRSLYATDASLYQIQPDVVVIPKNEADVRLALLEAKKQNLAILARVWDKSGRPNSKQGPGTGLHQIF